MTKRSQRRLAVLSVLFLVLILPFSTACGTLEVGIVHPTASALTAAATIPATETAGPATPLPVRGFGKVWREIQGARGRLGWATGEEFVMGNGAFAP
jgi:uncharacterized protein with LGFP repeats